MKVYDINIKLIYCTYTRKKLCLDKFMTRLWEKTQFFFLFLETRCELHFIFYKLFSNSIHCEYFSNNSNNWKKHMFYMLPTTLHIFFYRNRYNYCDCVHRSQEKNSKCLKLRSFMFWNLVLRLYYEWRRIAKD